MSSYPFPSFGRPGCITAALRELKPGEFFYASLQDVVSEFTIATQPLDLIFGPSEPWQETYQKRFGDTVEMTLEYHRDRVYFRHWIAVQQMPRMSTEIAPIEPRNGPSDTDSMSSMDTKIKRELVDVPMLVDRRTGNVVGIAFG